jgi:hypothetical protein
MGHVVEAEDEKNGGGSPGERMITGGVMTRRVEEKGR